MKTRSLFLVLVVVLLSTLLSPAHTRADAAPPNPPPGVSLLPGEDLTMVQMLSEEVVIEVVGRGTAPDMTGLYEAEGIKAEVTATFNFKNQSNKEEKLSVLFPYIFLDGWGVERPVQDFTVKVGNNQMTWQIIPNPPQEKYAYDVFTAWAGWGMTFPAKKEVTVEITYSMISMDLQDPGELLTYILETGAGWYGPILAGDIILRLPYEANRINVLQYGTTPGGFVSGNEVRWHFEDLEPTSEDNWEAVVLSPDIYQEIVSSQKAVEEDPGDLEALLALGNGTLNASINSKVGIFLHDNPAPQVELFMSAYRYLKEGVTKNPESAEVRELYLKFLHTQLGTLTWTTIKLFPDNFPIPSREHVFEQLDKLAELDPQNNVVNYWRIDFDSFFDFLESSPSQAANTTIPTETLLPLPSATEEQILEATFTMAEAAVPPTTVSSSAAETSTPSMQDFESPPASSNLGWYAVGVVLVVGLGFWFYKRRK